MDEQYDEFVYVVSPEAAADATTGFEEQSPVHPFVVTVEEPDHPSARFTLEAYDAYAAVGKLANLLSRVPGGGPATTVTITASTSDGQTLYPVCGDCGKQGPSVKRLGDSFGCSACLDRLLNKLVLTGELEARVREDGQVEYRATPLLMDRFEGGDRCE